MTNDTNADEKAKAAGRRPQAAEGSVKAVDDTARAVINEKLVSGARVYSSTLKKTVVAETASVNTMGASWSKSNPECRAGYVAEADSVATFNVDAVFQGKNTRAKILGSSKDSSADVIVTSSNTGKNISEVQVKVWKNPKHTADEQAGLRGRPRNYKEQVRVVPKDQLDAVRSRSTQKRNKEAERVSQGDLNRLEPYEKRDQVVRNVTDRIEAEGVESTPRTYDESQKIGLTAKDGLVTGADIVGGYGKRTLQGAKQAVPRAAMIGGVVSGAANSVRVATRYYRGEADGKTAALDALKETTVDTIAAGVKGAASGAATAAARVAAERFSSQAAKRVLGGSAPAIAAVFACEIAYGSIEAAMGRRTWGDLGQGMASSAKATVASMIGAEIGMLIGGPIGALIGGFGLPMALDFAKKWLQSATEEGQVEDIAGLVEAISDPKNIGAALTAMAAGKTGLAATRLLQLAGLFVMLGNQSAKVFPGRRVIGRKDYQTSVDIVVVHEGRVFAVDLTTKDGTFSPLGSRSQPIYGKLKWKGVAAKGLPIHRTIRNPLLGPAEFADAARNRLMKTNPRWRSAHIEPVMVFPTEATTLLSDLASNNRYLNLSRFEARLAAGDGRATPNWMLHDLMQLPAWDTIERADGTLTQAALEGEGIVLTLGDGPVDIPFASVAKIEIDRFDVKDADFATAKVTLKDAIIIVGVVAKQRIVTNRRGYQTIYDLRDLKTICPSQFLLAA